MYSKLLKVCLEEPNCRNFETWGYYDGVSWLAEPQNGLPFDRQYVPKLAYFKMWDVLTAFSRESSSVASRIAANKKDTDARAKAEAAATASSSPATTESTPAGATTIIGSGLLSMGLLMVG